MNIEDPFELELAQLRSYLALFLSDPDVKVQAVVDFLDRVGDLVDEALQSGSQNIAQDRLAAAARRAAFAGFLSGLEARETPMPTSEGEHLLRLVRVLATRYRDMPVQHRDVVRSALQASYRSIGEYECADDCAELTARLLVWTVAMVETGEFLD